MYSYSHKLPLPPSGPPPSKNPPSLTIPRPPSTPPPLTIPLDDIQTHQKQVNERMSTRLSRLGYRPDIRYNNTTLQRNPEFSNITFAIGKRATWAVRDFENREYGQPAYHDDNICGSGNDGLASTIQTQLNAGQLVEAINQIKRCISGREVTAVDRTHKNLIPIYKDFLEQLQLYMGVGGPNEEYQDVLRNGGFIVKFYHYTNPSVFIVSQARNLTYIDENLEEVLTKRSRKGGGSRKYKRTKNKRRRGTTKRTKRRKGYNQTIKRIR
jgi:hypothetical protein